MFKKFLSICLAFVFLISLTACNHNKIEEQSSTTSSFSQTDLSSTTISVAPSATTSTISKTPTTTTTSQNKTSTSNTTSAAPCTTHDWMGWYTQTAALVCRKGVLVRVCSNCGYRETKETTANAMFNSFSDTGLSGICQEYFDNNHQLIESESLLAYAALHSRNMKNLKSSTVFSYLSERFDISEQVKSEMLASELYNASTDTFNLEYNLPNGTTFLCYLPKGGLIYNAYYNYIANDSNGQGFIIEFQVQLNKVNDKPNKILSMKVVENLPSGYLNR